MSNSIEVFNNDKFGSVRAFADENGEPWFCVNDVAKALGYVNPRNALEKHCKEKGVAKRDTPTSGGLQVMTYINEANMYRLVFGSKLESAEQFQDWVVEDVLPTLRKTGSYSVTKNPVDVVVYSDNPLERCKALTAILEKQEEEKLLLEQQKHIAEQERDVYSDMVDDVMQDDHTYTATEIAKDLGLRSANALNKWLVEVGFFYKSGKYYIPYSKYSQKGFTSHKLYDTGHGFNVKTIKFTNAGKIWIVEKWKAQHQLLLGL